MKQGSAMRARVIFYAAIAMLAAGCHGAGSSNQGLATPSAVTQIPTTGSTVIGRAPEPTQIDAPGINIPSGDLNITIYNNSFEISARDWNTITNTSIVPQDIGVSIDPNVHASQTTRNRFQYLADRMFPYVKASFLPDGIVSVIKGSDDISIIAFINPTADTYELTGLTLSVKKGSPETTISSADFYTTPDTALTLPAKNIYFAWLSAPLIAKPPLHDPTNTTYNFNWSWLYDCGNAACPQPTV